ncbi:MAG: hypothetical protein HYX48_08095 [Chlamydiales bacterium]|nr:hypothetical protein [Chlamydiales bacterium]
MINPIKLEESFLEFTQNLQKWVPDGIISVNIGLLNELGLLNNNHLEQGTPENLSNFFHVIETPDKITLFNEQFAIWIVPKSEEAAPSTLTFIALLNANKPHLELVFSTTGVYNSPKYILKVLQHFLTDVIDTEATIAAIGKKQ